MRGEITGNVWDVLSGICSKHSLQALTIHKLTHLSVLKFRELTQDQILSDDLSLLPYVKDMYTKIWGDAAKNDKKEKWAKIKKTSISEGPPSGNDLKILATAAKLAQDRVVELLTFDHDFILFADEILNKFGISVKNGWQLK